MSWLVSCARSRGKEGLTLDSGFQKKEKIGTKDAKNKLYEGKERRSLNDGEEKGT